MPETCRVIYDNKIVASSWYLSSFSYKMHGHTYIKPAQTVDVVRTTSAKSCLRADDMRFQTQNTEQLSVHILICTILPVHSSTHRV